MKRLTHPVVLQYRRPESLTDGSIHYGVSSSPLNA